MPYNTELVYFIIKIARKIFFLYIQFYFSTLTNIITRIISYTYLYKRKPKLELNPEPNIKATNPNFNYIKKRKDLQY